MYCINCCVSQFHHIGVKYADAVWNDSRQSLFAELIIKYILMPF